MGAVALNREKYLAGPVGLLWAGREVILKAIRLRVGSLPRAHQAGQDAAWSVATSGWLLLSPVFSRLAGVARSSPREVAGLSGAVLAEASECEDMHRWCGFQ
jgi:hypothetical protein